MDELEAHLKERVRHYHALAGSNYYAAYSCVLVAALSSFATSALVVGSSLSKEVLAALTALPGGLLLLNQTFKFIVRSDWHRRKAYRLQRLLHAMKFEGRPVDQVSSDLATLNEEMLTEWNEQVGFSFKHNGK
jgi:hypothetical protein